jgi:glycosyltransferase involved in cell wall biosynthesis
MRIALLDPPSFTVPYDHHLASALAARGHDVHLLTSPFVFGDPPEPEGYAREEVFLPVSSRLVRRAPRSRLRYLAKGAEYGPSALRLLRRLGKLEPDVVHVQWFAEPRLDVHWLRRVKPPLVLTAHEPTARLERNRAAWREALGLADRVVVHSEHGEAQLVAQGVDSERIVRIAHPLFGDGPEPAPPEGRTILFFGLVRDYKGVDVLLRALPGVPDARLVVAGDPLDPAAPLQELAQPLGVAARVEWRLGFLPDPELEALLQDATLVALPYRRIDSSGVLATALGHGRPVVVSDVGSLGATVREFGAGLVVPAEDEQALAEALTALLTDEAALAEAFAGTQRARATLTWARAAEGHERVYETVAR